MIPSVLVTAAAFVFSYGLLDMLTLRQQSVVFTMLLSAYLVVRHRKRMRVVIPTRAVAAPPVAVQPTAATANRRHFVPPQDRPMQRSVSSEQGQINTLLRARKIPFQITSTVPTPDYYCYFLDKLPGATFAPLRSYVADLAHEVYRFRGNSGEPVTVTLNEQPPYLRVTAETRRILPWSERSKSLPAYAAQVGAYWTHTTQASMMTIDFSDQKQWAMGVFSSSGGGKSMLLRAALLSLLETSVPGGTEFYLIDLDSNQYDSYAALPHVRAIATTDAQALALLRHLALLVEDDRELTNTVRRFVVADEFQMLSAQSIYAEEIMVAMTVLAQRGRKHGINLLLSTQDPTGGNYPIELQRNTKVILAGLTEDDSYLVRFFGVNGADKLRGDGDFIFKSAGRQINFKGFYISDDDVAETISAICAKWGRDGSLMRFEEDASEADGEVLPLPQPPVGKRQKRIIADAEVVRPYLNEAYDRTTGQLRDGWGPRLLKQLYGEPKPNVGGYSTRLNEAVQYALNTTT